MITIIVAIGFHCLFNKSLTIVVFLKQSIHNIIIPIGINKHNNTDNGLVKKANVISPDNKYLAALTPPQPGQGIPVILWNGQNGWMGNVSPIQTHITDKIKTNVAIIDLRIFIYNIKSSLNLLKL